MRDAAPATSARLFARELLRVALGFACVLTLWFLALMAQPGAERVIAGSLP